MKSPQNRDRTGFNEGSSGRYQRERSESRQLLQCRIFKLTPQLKPVMRVKYYFDQLGIVAFHKLVLKVKQNGTELLPIIKNVFINFVSERFTWFFYNLAASSIVLNHRWIIIKERFGPLN